MESCTMRINILVKFTVGSTPTPFRVLLQDHLAVMKTITDHPMASMITGPAPSTHGTSKTTTVILQRNCSLSISKSELYARLINTNSIISSCLKGKRTSEIWLKMSVT